MECDLSKFKLKRFWPPDNDPVPGNQESRREHRIELFIRPAKLIVDGIEYLCILRDVSQGGVKLQVFHPMPSGRTYEVELPSGSRRALRHAWSNERFFGFEIINPLELRQFIEEASDTDLRKQIRINRSINGTIHVDDVEAPVLIKHFAAGRVDRMRAAHGAGAVRENP